MDHVHDHLGGMPLSRKLFVRDPPDTADVGSVLAVLNVAVSRELVTLVAVFASALAVPLASYRAVPATGPADPAGGQHQVDACDDIVHALGVVFDAPRVQ